MCPHFKVMGFKPNSGITFCKKKKKEEAKSEESTTVPKTEVSLMATLKSILKGSHEKVHNFTAEINMLTACYEAVFVSIALFPALHLNNGVAIRCQVTAIYRQLLVYKCL